MIASEGHDRQGTSQDQMHRSNGALANDSGMSIFHSSTGPVFLELRNFGEADDSCLKYTVL